MWRLVFIAVLLLTTLVRAGEPLVKFEPWSDALFERAKKEHKLVVLHLGAGWCHWCRVMENTTYADPRVAALIAKGFIAVHVEQDSRPDLAERYEEFGWPATIIFDSTGHEIVKRRGFIEPEPMAKLLQAVIDDPAPAPDDEKIPPPAASQPAAPTDAGLDTQTRQRLRQTLADWYDKKNFGWGEGHKLVDCDIIEFLLSDMQRRGPSAWKLPAMILNTLNASTKLIDPVWGGLCQYSDDGTWDSPHFEKLMSIQAENLRIYSLASEAYPDFREPYVKAAGAIYRFMCDFMTSPDGAFYCSQDADVVPGQHAGEYYKLDDAGRRKIGVPRIDKSLYARENGWAITGLAAYYRLTGDKAVLQRALKAEEWALAHRTLKSAGGTLGFRHGEDDSGRVFLADSLAMGRAFLALYGVTRDASHLQNAEAVARFIAQRFAGDGGFVSAVGANGAIAGPAAPLPNLDENIAICVWSARLSRLSKEPAAAIIARRAMRLIASPAVADSRRSLGGVLLADDEINRR